MRYMGIDYGKKRVGVAISDESGKFALPHSVILNDEKLIKTIVNICKEKDVSVLVVGESKDFSLRDNLIMRDIKEFIGIISLEMPDIRVELEPEFMTSAQAERTVFRRSDTTAKRLSGRDIKKSKEMLDASAAALILKHFLEKNHGAK